MLVKTYCAAVNGLEVTTVTVEVSVTKGVNFHLSGLADTAIKESRDRIASALKNNGIKLPVVDTTINMAPADLRKEGSGYDLPMAIGILAAIGKVKTDMLSDYMIMGELGLDGKIQPIRGALPIAIRARKEGFKGLIVPQQNIREAAVVNKIHVYGMDNLLDVVRFMNGEGGSSLLSSIQDVNFTNSKAASTSTSPTSVDKRASSGLWKLRQQEDTT